MELSAAFTEGRDNLWLVALVIRDSWLLELTFVSKLLGLEWLCIDGRHLRPYLIYLFGLTYFAEVSQSINLLGFSKGFVLSVEETQSGSVGSDLQLDQACFIQCSSTS